jgi:hypothetical protein
MRKLIVTTLAALALAGCGATQSPSASAQLRQLSASFTAAYAAHDASKACSLFTAHGRELVVQQVKLVGYRAATCEDAMRIDFVTVITIPPLVSVRIHGNQAALNYDGLMGNAVKQNGTWKFDSDVPWA